MYSTVLTADGLALAKDYIGRVLKEIEEARVSIDGHVHDAKMAMDEATMWTDNLEESLNVLAPMLMHHDVDPSADEVGDVEVSDV